MMLDAVRGPVRAAAACIASARHPPPPFCEGQLCGQTKLRLDCLQESRYTMSSSRKQNELDSNNVMDLAPRRYSNNP